MKTLNLILLSLLLPLFCFSQSNYQPGFIINLKGDTIKGFIDYKGWDKTPTSISFKDNISSQNIKQLTKNEISFFSIIGVESYQKFIGNISLNNIEADHIGYGSDTTYRVDTVFFKILQKGNNLALYSYTDKIKTRYYLGENPDYTPKELIYRIYKNSKTEENNQFYKTTIVEDTYLKQLFALANKYNSLDDELSRIFTNGQYSESYLLKIFSKINKIKTYDINKNVQPKLNYFVGAGLSYDSQYAGSDISIIRSTLPLISGGINLIPKPKSEKIELRVELQLSMSKYNPSLAPKNNSINLLNITLMPQIIFNFYNKEDFKIFLGGGLAVSHHNFFNTNSLAYQDYASYTTNTFLLKAGIKTSKKIAIYMNILTDYSVNTSDFSNIFNNTVNVGVLYFWGK